MALSANRVVVQGQTPHVHEQEALSFLLSQLPDHDPYCVWAFVTLSDPAGRRHELDALVLGYHALYLIEVKSHPARFTGSVVDWVLEFADGGRTTIENPLRLTEQKAKVLAGLLDRRLARDRRPWVEPLVFLSHSEAKLELRGGAETNVVTRASLQKALTHGVFPGANPRLQNQRVDAPASKAVMKALRELGLAASKGASKIGELVVGDVIDDGAGWQDREAQHERMALARRVRSYLVPQSPTQERREQLRRAAEREARVLAALADHPGILRFIDYAPEGPFGGPALVFERFEGSVPLDVWLRQNQPGDLGERLELLRQLGDALDYCHRKGVLHRGLHPGAVLVRKRPGQRAELRLCNFQLASEAEGSHGTRHLSALAADPAILYRAPELVEDPSRASRASDVFSLGAIAYHLLTGRPPGADLAERQRLLAEGHLSVAAARDDLAASGVGEEDQKGIEELVAEATDVNPVRRADSALDWVNLLDETLHAPARRPEERRDPLEAKPGDALGDGLVVKRLLGTGSTARVFHVVRGTTEFALKVPLSAELEERLRGEGEVLERLRSERIVSLEGTPVLGGRFCLLLAYAGETLADILRREGPASLDFARRWGEDLLFALQGLEEKGIGHRDVKPANVGVVERSKKAKHLVLFDFSLSTVDVRSIAAGTPVYRDPFLQLRGSWDAAADRYSAALTLHEMLTGALPRYGSGQVAAVFAHEEATVEAERFDPSVRDRLLGFFRKALARDASARHGSAEEMRRSWLDVFAAPLPVAHPVPVAPGAQVSLETPIEALPLSARAKNALDRSGVVVVRELLRLPSNHLSAMRGVGRETAVEIVQLLEQLRERFVTTGAEEPQFAAAYRGPDGAIDFVPNLPAEAAGALQDAGLGRLSAAAAAAASRVERVLAPWPGAATKLGVFLRSAGEAAGPGGPATIEAWVEALLPVPARKGETFLAHARLLFGLDGDEPPPASASELASRLGKTRQLVHVSLGKARERWLDHPALPELHEHVGAALEALGGAASVARLAEALPAQLPHRPGVEAAIGLRGAAALVRVVAETGRQAVLSRVHDVPWLGKTDAHLDAVRALGKAADDLAGREPLASSEEVRDVLVRTTSQTPLGRAAPDRLAAIAADASRRAARSARLELYPRGMAPERALALCAGALGAGTTPGEVRAIVRARYPDAQPLPDRPALDGLLAPLGFSFDEETGRYARRGLPGAASTTQRPTRRPTTHTSHRPKDERAREAEEFEARLRLAVQRGSFRVLEVTDHEAEPAADQVARRLGLVARSLEAELLAELDSVTAEWQVDPGIVADADRAGPGNDGWDNLRRLAQEAGTRLLRKLTAAKAPLLLTHPGLVARYKLDAFLTGLVEAAASDDGPAVLLVVPAHDQAGPAPIHAVEGGLSIPVTSPAQRVRVPQSFIRNEHRGGEA